MSVDYSSYYQNESIRQAANDRATQAYNRAKLSGESEDRAQAAREFEWKKTYEEAGLTGYYQGAPTMGTQQWWASNFGSWNAPTTGQQTMAREGQVADYTGQFQGQQTQAAQQQQFGQGQQLAAMYGTYLAPGQTPGAGTQTQAAQEQQFTQGLRTQQQALAEQTQQQAAANQYLTLLSSLRGPADWAKYQEVLNAGGSMNNLAAMAMGQYVPGGGATSGVQPQAANLNTMYNQVAQAGGQQGYGQPQQAGGPMSYDQAQQMRAQYAGQQPQNQVQNQYGDQAQRTYQMLQGQMGGAPSEQQAVAQGQQKYGQQGPPQLPNAAGNGTNMMGAQQLGQRQNQMNLPAPNQVAPQAWKGMTPSQQEMIKGEYEAQGWYKPDVEALMNQGLPKYAANAPGAGTWRLR